MSGLRFGYGTSGFADHRLEEALDVVAGLGYAGVAITLDHQHLDPFGPDLAAAVATTRERLAARGLAAVVETGARYVLDPWHKHSPTLLDDRPDRRVEYLSRAIAIGAELGAEAVSFWSGAQPPGLDDDLAWQRLAGHCADLIEIAQAAGVVLGFEPEPGMLVDTTASWRRLHAMLGRPPAFGLTLDIGHVQVLEDLPIADRIAEVAPYLVNVQIEDMRRGVHDHLEFGEGEIDFPPVLQALIDAGYGGLVSVELSRHSHAAPVVARRSLEFLRAAADEGSLT